MSDIKTGIIGEGPRGPRGPRGHRGHIDQITADPENFTGDGTPAAPLSTPRISAMVHAVASFDADSNVTYSVEVLNLAGGITFSGFENHAADGFLKILLTLPFPVAHHLRVGLATAHLVPPLPTNFLDGQPWLPLAIEEGSDGTSVILLAPTNGKAPTTVPAVTTLGLTYALWVAPA